MQLYSERQGTVLCHIPVLHCISVSMLLCGVLPVISISRAYLIVNYLTDFSTFVLIFFALFCQLLEMNSVL